MTLSEILVLVTVPVLVLLLVMELGIVYLMQRIAAASQARTLTESLQADRLERLLTVMEKRHLSRPPAQAHLESGPTAKKNSRCA